jgi:hypothetical protein
VATAGVLNIAAHVEIAAIEPLRSTNGGNPLS